jgi:hypothetical protein
MYLYHRTNFGQNEPVIKAIVFVNFVTGLVFMKKKVCILFVVASVMLCLESVLDFNNILDELICTLVFLEKLLHILSVYLC